MTNNELGRIIKQRRVMIPLTLSELAAKSGVSASHIGRIERGERFPAAGILRKLAKPLDLDESLLLTIAGYLSPQPSTEAEGVSGKRLDPYVARVLSEEPVEVQRTVIGILTMLKSMSKGSGNIGFREYARRQYPELDEDTITMIEDILEHSPKGPRGTALTKPTE